MENRTWRAFLWDVAKTAFKESRYVIVLFLIAFPAYVFAVNQTETGSRLRAAAGIIFGGFVIWKFVQWTNRHDDLREQKRPPDTP